MMSVSVYYMNYLKYRSGMWAARSDGWVGEVLYYTHKYVYMDVYLFDIFVHTYTHFNKGRPVDLFCI